MQDLLSPDVVAHAPHIKHAAKKVIMAAPEIKQGISMLTLLASNGLTMLVSAGLAWYIRGRGMTGVKIDMDNAKNEINKLKDQVSALVAKTPMA